MKKVLLFTAIIFTGSVFSQTNVISSKDHSLSNSHILQEEDNFGELPYERRIDTVEYIGKNKFVLYAKHSVWGSKKVSHYQYDTIQDMDNNGVLTEKLMRNYGDIVYLNFKKPKQHKKWQRNINKNSFPLFVVISILVFFLFSLIKSPQKNGN